MTNSLEGDLFVDTDILQDIGVTKYVTQLFPHLEEGEIEEIVQQYTGIGLNTDKDQVVAIIGEGGLIRIYPASIIGLIIVFLIATFICPTYTVLSTFSGDAYKVLYYSLLVYFHLLTPIKGQFAIPPGNHASDLQYYMPGAK